MLAQAVKVRLRHRRRFNCEFLSIFEHRAIGLAELSASPVTLELCHEITILRLHAKALRMGVGSIVAAVYSRNDRRDHLFLRAREMRAAKGRGHRNLPQVPEQFGPEA